MEYTTQLADFGFMSNIPGAVDISLYMFLPQEDLMIVKESVDDDRGEPGTSDIQARLNLRYILDNWSVLWQSRYIGKATINNNDTATSRDVRELDPVWLFNAAFTYRYSEMVRFQVNINNVFDEEPEPAAIASGTDNVHDNIGRYLGAGVKISL